MVPDASKKKAAQKKLAGVAKRGGKVAASSSKAANGVDKVANGVSELSISDRTCTGILCLHPLSRDIPRGKFTKQSATQGMHYAVARALEI